MKAHNSLRTKTGYLDCFSGVSGDMLLGALLDTGLEPERLHTVIDGLNLDGVRLEITTVKDSTIRARKVRVHSDRSQQLRTLPAILDQLENSDCPPVVRQRSEQVFRRLAEAEARVHNIDLDKVHFHEIGAIDTIVDIVGTVFGLYELGIERLLCSPLPLGRGFVDCAHGRLPLPAPAVCEMIDRIPVYGVNIAQELVTPTGAALVTTLADDFGPIPPMTSVITGYGAGSHRLENGQPNLLRLLIGDSWSPAEAQLVEIIETNVDDWNPEGYPYLCERLFHLGALDVTLTPVQMKKGRPGYTLQVIGAPHNSQALKDCLLSETTAIGLRFRQEARQTLAREIIEVDTPWGGVKAKKVQTPAGPAIYPEYEECRRLATASNIPLQTVYAAIRKTVCE